MGQIIFTFTPLDRTPLIRSINADRRARSTFSDLANAFAQPLRRSLDYQGLGRRLSSVDPIPDQNPNRNSNRYNDPFGNQSEQRRNRQRFLPRQDTSDTYRPAASLTSINETNREVREALNANTLEDIRAEEDRRILETILAIADSNSPDGVEIEMLSTAEGVPEGESRFHHGSSVIEGVDMFLTTWFRT
jgi:hypothetical protein